MDGFFKQVAEVDKQIDKINEQLDKLQAAREEGKQATKASSMKAIKTRMEKDIEEVSRIALKVKGSLEALDRDNVANWKKPGCQKGSGVDRSRTSMITALKKKLKERISQFQTLRETIQTEYHEVVERRVFTVTGTHPDEETINRLIETGNGEQIFATAIEGQGRGEVMDTLAEIQERRDTFVELEKKLLDLQQVFMDMATLVDSQGELLDDIEAQVSSSVDHVQKATVTLQKAKALQKNTRKYMCIATLLLIIVIAVALIPILKSLKKHTSTQTPRTN